MTDSPKPLTATKLVAILTGFVVIIGGGLGIGLAVHSHMQQRDREQQEQRDAATCLGAIMAGGNAYDTPECDS